MNSVTPKAQLISHGPAEGAGEENPEQVQPDRADQDERRPVMQSPDEEAPCAHHKVRVVQAFQRMGRTVAMTGDGANDVPAVRLADIGIAFGTRAAPAARAAADLIVMDDRLETMLNAFVEGRAMWASVRQAPAILGGGNFGEIAFTLLGTAATTGTDLPPDGPPAAAGQPLHRPGPGHGRRPAPAAAGGRRTDAP